MIYHYNEVPIFYEQQGDGPAIILLHGFLESTAMWSSFVPKLATTQTVITIDLPGHGKSDCIGPIHTMEQMADVVNSLLEHLTISTATLVGHSMGGYVALAFTEKHEHKVKQLILLNSTSNEDSPERKLNRERALDIITKNKTAFVSMAISNLFVEGSQGRYASVIEKLKKEALQFPLEGITAAIKGMKIRKDRTWVLKNFSRKKIIIGGSEDPIVPLSSSQVIAKNTKSELIILEGGHMIWSEKPDDCVKILHLIG